MQLHIQSEKMGNLLKKRHLFSCFGVSTSVKQTIDNFFSLLLLAQMYHRYFSTFLKFVSRLFLPGRFYRLKFLSPTLYVVLSSLNVY